MWGERVQVKRQLMTDLAVPEESAQKIIDSLSCKSIEELVALTGSVESPAVTELKELFKLADDYGFGDYLLFDASVVRRWIPPSFHGSYGVAPRHRSKQAWGNCPRSVVREP